jgi:hypothetical protein
MKKADNFDAKQWLVENKITTQSRLNEQKYIKIDNSEYYVDENGNVKLSLNFPYKFNRSDKYNTPREEYIDKNNWKEKVNPNFPIMKVINNVPTADYEFIEYPSGDKELVVKTNIEDLKKYENGNYTLVENKVTTQSQLNEEKPTDNMVKDYWSIMVENQPEDVVNILVGLTNGDLPFEKFSLDTANDVYDSFRDESYDNEDED